MAFWLKDLRGNVIGSSTDGSSFLSGKRYFGGKAKIAHFDVHVIAEKEVSEFEVSMDNFFIMKVTQCFEYLKHEEPGLVLWESSFPFYEVIKSLNYKLDYLVGT